MTFPSIKYVLSVGRPVEALPEATRLRLEEMYPNAEIRFFRPKNAEDALDQVQELGGPDQVKILVPPKPIVHLAMAAGYHVVAEQEDGSVMHVHGLEPDVRNYLFGHDPSAGIGSAC